MAYVELHCHSNFSFQEGASFPHELLLRAQQLGYSALALTDHDNLTAALDFAHAARSMGIQPIIGAEVTLKGGAHLTLLAETQQGYANLSRLLSYAHVGSERRHPEMDTSWFEESTRGLIALTGCVKGEVPTLAAKDDADGAKAALRQYLDWFGSGNVYLELQQNLVYGDTARNRRLVALGQELDVPLVATNNVHYHVQDRYKLHDALVAVKNLKTLEDSQRERRANDQFYLKSADEMEGLFKGLPEALTNTIRIAERCSFDLSRDLGYRFPDYPVPEGSTPDSHLRRICEQAAQRKYGEITSQVKARMDEELRRIAKHKLAGFFLIYYDIIQLAREVMLDLGLGDPEVPLEDNPPGRGRGSSVAMMVGYLIGLSHIDPLKYDLGLDRFLPEDLANVPDIDLDFPRNIREELILRVHEKYGWDHAALTGAISTYQVRGVVRDLGKVLSLPPDQIDRLAKRVDGRSAKHLKEEMERMSDFKHLVTAPGWRDLLGLAPQLADFPRLVQQHSGGMIISSTPLIETVPVMQGAIDGRYVMQWDKDSVDLAGMVKIDFLALGALSQMQEAVALVEKRTGEPLDMSRIDFEDGAVYDAIERADTIGIFQVESAAQMQTTPRLKPRNLVDMAFEVAAVRPGVGVNDGVTQFIHRRNGEPWSFDHPLEKEPLGRTHGVILYQDQVNEVAMSVAGMSGREADQLRRAFTKKKNEELIAEWWERFREGAAKRGVPPEIAERIFQKFNGQYMFPEAHAYAFGITAYQMSWLKLYYPLEFYTGLLNEQPMGFWSPETIKEDAKRHGVRILNPDANLSEKRCTVEGDAIRLGFSYVENMGETSIERFADERTHHGEYRSLADVVERSGLQRAALDSLADAGAFDSLKPDRREAKWEIGLLYRPADTQIALALPTEQDRADLPQLTRWETLGGEYESLGMAPDGHVMEELRASLPSEVIPSNQLDDYDDDSCVFVAGRVVRRQRPLAKAVFITLEDEFGHVPLIVWPKTWDRLRDTLKEPYLIVEGRVSRREGTLNVVVQRAKAYEGFELPYFAHDCWSHDWR